MKKYIWILSGVVAMALIIYACDPALISEKIIASVEKMPSDMSFGWETDEQSLTGHDNTFTFVSDANWCIVSGDKIKVETNTTDQSRVASVNVNWKNETMKIIRVRQSEMSSIGGLPETVTFDSESGSKTFELTSSTSWTVSSDQEWCSVTPTNGSGNVSLKVSVTNNTTSSTRTARITFKSGTNTKVITVTQTGDTILSISPTSINTGATAATYSINITSNLSWTATSSQSWCSITPTSGSDNSTILVDVNENTSTSSRTATITIESEGVVKTVSISQAGAGTVIIPINDQFYNAISIPCGTTLNGTTVGATEKNIPYAHTDKYGVWYTFMGNGLSNYISINGDPRFEHPKIRLYEGSRDTIGRFIYADGFNPLITFFSNLGSQYYLYVVVQSQSSETGTFSISRSCDNPLPTPTNVKATQSGHSIIVTWDRVPEAKGYSILYRLKLNDPEYFSYSGYNTFGSGATSVTIDMPWYYEKGEYNITVQAFGNNRASDLSSPANCYYVP